MNEYANLTGFPHMPPLWSLGYQQSHRTLTSRDEVLNIVQTFRDKKLPCDSLIYLGTGFCPSGWNTGHGSFTFNDRVFPGSWRDAAEDSRNHFEVVSIWFLLEICMAQSPTPESMQMVPGDASAYWIGIAH